MSWDRHLRRMATLLAGYLALAALVVVDARAAGGGAMKLESATFAANARIPKRHTCEGQDVPPALAWSGVPPNAKSLALVVDDPDAPDPAAPKTTWVHWVVYDLPPTTAGLAEGASTLPDGARVGLNDWEHARWNGPCPPIGRHGYVFKLYALDSGLATSLGDMHQPTKAQLERAMNGHVIAEARLVGTYQKGD